MESVDGARNERTPHERTKDPSFYSLALRQDLYYASSIGMGVDMRIARTRCAYYLRRLRWPEATKRLTTGA